MLCASVDSHGRPFPFVAFQTFAVAAWDLDPASVLGLHAEFLPSLKNWSAKSDRWPTSAKSTAASILCGQSR